MARRLTGDEVKARRRALGLTQNQLAECLGIKQVKVFRWESGKTRTKETLAADLSSLEDRLEAITKAMLDHVESVAGSVGVEKVSILVHGDDASFWQAYPEHEGLPVVLQHVAAARARREFDADIPIIAITL